MVLPLSYGIFRSPMTLQIPTVQKKLTKIKMKENVLKGVKIVWWLEAANKQFCNLGLHEIPDNTYK